MRSVYAPYVKSPSKAGSVASSSSNKAGNDSRRGSGDHKLQASSNSKFGSRPFSVKIKSTRWFPKRFTPKAKPYYDKNAKRERFQKGISGSQPKKDFHKVVKAEDDIAISRVLYVGNLDPCFTKSDLEAIFGCYGKVLNVVLKVNTTGRTKPYAFVSFEGFQDATQAKEVMHNTRLGSCNVVIGYGKNEPTYKVWIENVDREITTQLLERELDRFGAITKLERFTADGVVTVEYQSVYAAEEAKSNLHCQVLVPGSTKRLLVDFYAQEKNIKIAGGLLPPMVPSAERELAGDRKKNSSPPTQHSDGFTCQALLGGSEEKMLLDASSRVMPPSIYCQSECDFDF